VGYSFNVGIYNFREWYMVERMTSPRKLISICPASPFDSQTEVGLRRDILLSTCHNFCEAIPEFYSLIGEAEWWS